MPGPAVQALKGEGWGVGGETLKVSHITAVFKKKKNQGGKYLYTEITLVWCLSSAHCPTLPEPGAKLEASKPQQSSCLHAQKHSNYWRYTWPCFSGG